MQVRAKKREQAKLDKAVAKIAAIKAKKAAKKFKPSRIIILRVGSLILSNIAA
jgi:hypothetical protein